MDSQMVLSFADEMLAKSDIIVLRINELRSCLGSIDGNVDEIIDTITKKNTLNKLISQTTDSIRSTTSLFNIETDNTEANKQYAKIQDLKDLKHKYEVELRQLTNTKKTTPDIRAIKKEIKKLEKERRIILNGIAEKVYEFMNEAI